METEDAEGYAELLSDETSYPHITDGGPVGASRIPSKITRNRELFDEGSGIYWALERNGIFIGFVALHGPSESVPSLSYAIRARWRRLGYATEALDAVCNYALSTLRCRELAARSHLDNAASAALLARVGFRNVGVVSVGSGKRNEYRRAAT